MDRHAVSGVDDRPETDDEELEGPARSEGDLGDEELDDDDEHGWDDLDEDEGEGEDWDDLNEDQDDDEEKLE